MSAWVNLAAISTNAKSREPGRWATDRQVGAVAGWLCKLMKEMLATQLGLSLGSEALRDLRLQFLNDALYPCWWCGSKLLTTTKQISFSEASAILDWVQSDSAADDMAVWLMEQDLSYTKEMFGGY